MGRKNLPPNPFIFPTPGVFVTLLDESGKPNIITLAWTGVASTTPPMIGISIRSEAYNRPSKNASNITAPQKENYDH